MAKLLFVLVGVLVILNGMTFLLVVNQSSPAAPSPAASTATAPRAGGSDAQIRNLESVLQSIKSSVAEISRKVSSLEARVGSLAKSSAHSNIATPPATGGGSTRMPSAVRKGPLELSRPVAPPTRAAPAAVNAAPAEEEEGEEEPAAPTPVSPPPDGSNPAAGGETAEGGSETQPAPADGATPSDATGQDPNSQAQPQE